MLIMAFPNWQFIRQKQAGSRSCGDSARWLAVIKSRERGDLTETHELVERHLNSRAVNRN